MHAHARTRTHARTHARTHRMPYMSQGQWGVLVQQVQIACCGPFSSACSCPYLGLRTWEVYILSDCTQKNAKAWWKLTVTQKATTIERKYKKKWQIQDKRPVDAMTCKVQKWTEFWTKIYIRQRSQCSNSTTKDWEWNSSPFALWLCSKIQSFRVAPWGWENTLSLRDDSHDNEEENLSSSPMNRHWRGSHLHCISHSCFQCLFMRVAGCR